MLADVAALATAIGVLAAVVQLLLSRRQSRAEFEQQFVKRYWELSDDELTNGGADSSVQRKRYFRFCEDEFEVMRLGSISWRTWEVWHDAIRKECLVDRHLIALDWLSECLQQPADHRGADCEALFAPTADTRSGHLSARSRTSPSRRLFIVETAIRARLYRGQPPEAE